MKQPVRTSAGSVAHWTPVSRIGACLLATAASLASLDVSGAAPKLRYAFQAGQKYVYEVKITAELGGSTETREGLSIFTVKSDANSEFVLAHQGWLTTQRNNNGAGNRSPWTRPEFRRHAPWADQILVRPGELTINPLGEVIRTTAETPLPYALGSLETLAIEQLSGDGKARWEQKREVSIAQRQRQRLPRPRFVGEDGDGTRRSAAEVVRFAITGSAAGLVQIKRDYSLRTAEKAGDSPSLEMEGSGELVFDPGRGAFRSHALRYVFKIHETNLSLSVPVTVNCQLLAPEEAEHRLKAREETLAAAAANAAKANEPKPVEAAERERLMQDLRSNEEAILRRAADRLARAPADDQAEAVAEALVPLLGDRSSFVRTAAARALVSWGTEKSVAALVKAVEDSDLWVRRAAMEALGRQKSPVAAKAVAARLVQMQDRSEAVKTLKAMGAAAESEVAPYLKDRDMWVQLESCKLLGQIGTPQSVPALEEYGRSGKPMAAAESRKAIQAVRNR